MRDARFAELDRKIAAGVGCKPGRPRGSTGPWAESKARQERLEWMRKRQLAARRRKQIAARLLALAALRVKWGGKRKAAK